MFPTLLAAAGVKQPPGVVLDGFDMLPVLQGKAKSSRSEMFWQMREAKAARVGSHKWVESAKGGGLFDLSTDPGEKTDLSAAKPEVVDQLKERFAGWRKADGRGRAARAFPGLLTSDTQLPHCTLLQRRA